MFVIILHQGSITYRWLYWSRTIACHVYCNSKIVSSRKNKTFFIRDKCCHLAFYLQMTEPNFFFNIDSSLSLVMIRRQVKEIGYQREKVKICAAVKKLSLPLTAAAAGGFSSQQSLTKAWLLHKLTFYVKVSRSNWFQPSLKKLAEPTRDCKVR